MRLLLLVLVFSVSCTTTTKTKIGFDAELTGFNYPFATHRFAFESQSQKLQMTYMDIKPQGDIKDTIVLLHGKNFSGYYFEGIIKNLSQRGYRVIVPDQVGFGKSTKPASYQYSFQVLTDNTHQLLQSLQVSSYQVLGHSMGGMLATRLALTYPNEVSRLLLVNPIGLEDWKTMTSYKTIDQNYKNELTNSAEKIRSYQKLYYYDGKWNEDYETLIQTHLGWLRGPDSKLVAWNAALTSDMIFTQPVYYEFKNLKMPTVLIIGQRDGTAIGKAWAPKENQAKMGNYTKMGRDVQKMIPKAELIELPGLGHMPFIESPHLFWEKTSKIW